MDDDVCGGSVGDEEEMQGAGNSNMDDVELVQSWHPLMGLPNDEPLEMDP